MEACWVLEGWRFAGLRYNQGRDVQELHKMDGGEICFANADATPVQTRECLKELRQSAEPDIVIMLVGNKACNRFLRMLSQVSSTSHPRLTW